MLVAKTGTAAMRSGRRFASKYADRIGPKITPAGFAKTAKPKNTPAPMTSPSVPPKTKEKLSSVKKTSSGSAKKIRAYNKTNVHKAKHSDANQTPSSLF